MASGKDVFKHSEVAINYAKYRPVYPSTVYDKILEYLGNGSEFNVGYKYKLAVDVGCGSGQATFPLCQHFESVIGMDTSEDQIEQARLKVGQGQVQGQGNVTFRVGDAENLSFLSDNSVDLITAAAAIHWFDVEKFCVECHRVLRPGGVLAAYSYGVDSFFGVDGQPLAEINEIHRDVLFKENTDLMPRHYFDKYSQIFVIFKEIFTRAKRDDSVNMETKYNVEDFQGFLRSMRRYWMMCDKYPDKPDPVNVMRDCLLQVYNNNPPQDAVTVNNEVFIVMGQK